MRVLNYNFESRVTKRITTLRKQKHEAGFPFMVESYGELPTNQAYMEYADGRVEIVEFDDKFQDYASIKELKGKDLSDFRQKYKLQDA
ncbi:hypothetical protein [Emticicia soli]|uniref:Uncharacterized protein n=1 Tax=Emticicia soli TaxID=2027878 RepID=A0ABW5JBS9_9BACT